MKVAAFIVLIAAGMTLCTEDARSQDRNQARQTVSFGVFLSNANSMTPRTITVAPLSAEAKSFSAISLRALIPLQPTTRKDIPLKEISSKLVTRELLVTISD